LEVAKKLRRPPKEVERKEGEKKGCPLLKKFPRELEFEGKV